MKFKGNQAQALLAIFTEVTIRNARIVVQVQNGGEDQSILKSGGDEKKMNRVNQVLLRFRMNQVTIFAGKFIQLNFAFLFDSAGSMGRF